MDASVGQLREMIADRARFNNVVAERIELRKVDFSRAQLRNLGPDDFFDVLGEMLFALDEIRESFPSVPDPKHLHILISLPGFSLVPGTLFVSLPSLFIIFMPLIHIFLRRFIFSGSGY